MQQAEEAVPRHELRHDAQVGRLRARAHEEYLPQQSCISRLRPQAAANPNDCGLAAFDEQAPQDRGRMMIEI